jgi:tRNA-Thr(GGU) m(6)t(6)A37 methyltransferase TsaA
VNEWEPIAVVRTVRKELKDDFRGSVTSTIELLPGVPEESLTGLDAFSHIEVIYLFHHYEPDAELLSQRHPRGNPEWPDTGIFAQRASRRPNRIGATIVPLKNVHGRTLTVTGLDAVDETPVLDIKPVFKEFLPREPVRQPA